MAARLGLTYSDIRELMLARKAGASFASTLMIGRQSLFLHPGEMDSPDQPSFGGYADDFLMATLGITELEILDASDYEGATAVHDLNYPLPFSRRFDAVIDGGSLEHIFNVPVALASYMRALTVGGRLFVSTPANNLCGHGLYQFSPELMFRALAPERGFQIRRIMLAEARYPSIELSRAVRRVEVVDPDELKERGVLVSRRPIMLTVHAEKVRHLDEPFADAPQQSDYVARWERRDPARSAGGWLDRTIRGLRQRRRYSLRNPRFYRR